MISRKKMRKAIEALKDQMNLKKSINIESAREILGLEKSRQTKYFKREGTPGNYKYYYTKEEYEQAKGQPQPTKDSSQIKIADKTFKLSATGEGMQKYSDGQGTEYHSKKDEHINDFYKRVSESIKQDFKHLEKKPGGGDSKGIDYLKGLLNKDDAEITIVKNTSGDRIAKVNGQTAFNLDDRGMDEAGRKSALNRAYEASKSSNKSAGGDTPVFKPGDEGDLVSHEGEKLSYRVYKDGGVKIEGANVRKDFTSKEDAYKWMKDNGVVEKNEISKALEILGL